jgi:hypothetical protein
MIPSPLEFEPSTVRPPAGVSLRPLSAKEDGTRSVTELYRGDRLAHGFYLASATSHCCGVSHYWNPADELGCRWDDPILDLARPTINPLLSPRDANESSYRELERRLTDQNWPLR